MSALKLLFVPSKIILLLFIVSIVFILMKRWQTAARRMLISAGVLYFLFSTGLVSTMLLSPLEYKYPAMHNPQDYPQSKAIVVLTAYSVDDRDMPLSSRLNAPSLYRAVETHYIYKHCQGCRVYITGEEESAGVIQQQLIEFGIPESAILIDVAPHTYNSAVNMRQVFSKEPFFLVTTAGHMPRAMGVFEKQGMKPIPVPTDHRMPKNVFAADLMPKSHHLYYSDLAVTEYAGIVWYWLMDRI